MERCEVCGFVWDAVTAPEVAPGILDATTAIAALLRAAGPAVSVRPEQDRWSALEYGAHVRDVLFNVRDRIVQMIVEDEPTFAMLWRDDRVRLGLYAGDDPHVVADEVRMAGELYARTFERIDPASLGRTAVYSYPTAVPRTVLWVAAQTLHECRHHLADVEEVLAAVG